MHPESKNRLTDLQHFADKVKAGADGAITQYFYDADAYFKFVDATEKLGINIPITPGISASQDRRLLQYGSDGCIAI
jgi:methylenetetrahydrofolate reductase (NADPH)